MKHNELFKVLQQVRKGDPDFVTTSSHDAISAACERDQWHDTEAEKPESGKFVLDSQGFWVKRFETRHSLGDLWFNIHGSQMPAPKRWREIPKYEEGE